MLVSNCLLSLHTEKNTYLSDSGWGHLWFGPHAATLGCAVTKQPTALQAVWGWLTQTFRVRGVARSQLHWKNKSSGSDVAERPSLSLSLYLSLSLSLSLSRFWGLLILWAVCLLWFTYGWQCEVGGGWLEHMAITTEVSVRWFQLRMPLLVFS